MKLYFVLAWIGFAIPAFAGECPRLVDARHGVTLTRDTQKIESRYRLGPEGLLEDRLQDIGHGPETIVQAYAHALAPTKRTSPRNETLLTYAAPTEALGQLPAQKVWTSDVSLTVDGSPAGTGTATKTFLGKDKIKIGKCTYAVWAVKDQLVLGPDDGTYFLQFFSPELGVIVQSIKMDAEGKPLSGVQYDRIVATDE